jgi:hypothetical protein
LPIVIVSVMCSRSVTPLIFIHRPGFSIRMLPPLGAPVTNYRLELMADG